MAARPEDDERAAPIGGDPRKVRERKRNHALVVQQELRAHLSQRSLQRTQPFATSIVRQSTSVNDVLELLAVGGAPKQGGLSNPCRHGTTLFELLRRIASFSDDIANSHTSLHSIFNRWGPPRLCWSYSVVSRHRIRGNRPTDVLSDLGSPR